MVNATKYSSKKDKLSQKTKTAFNNNAIVYEMKILNEDDPLDQMIKLNNRKTF